MVDYLLDNVFCDTVKKFNKFYFFPFPNIDGIIWGNTTTNLTGSSLNNCWGTYHPYYQPEL
jgi:hypothetical protein